MGTRGLHTFKVGSKLFRAVTVFVRIFDEIEEKNIDDLAFS